MPDLSHLQIDLAGILLATTGCHYLLNCVDQFPTFLAARSCAQGLITRMLMEWSKLVINRLENFSPTFAGYPRVSVGRYRLPCDGNDFRESVCRPGDIHALRTFLIALSLPPWTIECFPFTYSPPCLTLWTWPPPPTDTAMSPGPKTWILIGRSANFQFEDTKLDSGLLFSPSDRLRRILSCLFQPITWLIYSPFSVPHSPPLAQSQLEFCKLN